MRKNTRSIVTNSITISETSPEDIGVNLSKKKGDKGVETVSRRRGNIGRDIAAEAIIRRGEADRIQDRGATRGA